jgi:toxin ParE1/3/4
VADTRRSIVCLPDARADLVAVVSYIAERNPDAASKLLDQIESSVKPLARHPNLYRAGRIGGTREMVVHPNYIVVYRVGAAAIGIVSVLHSRRVYP